MKKKVTVRGEVWKGFKTIGKEIKRQLSVKAKVNKPKKKSKYVYF